MRKAKGFTLIELMVVIMIVGILAAVAIPLMRGRIDSAKWSEANGAAGTIRTAVRAYYAEKGLTTANGITGTLDVTATQTALGFAATDLTGTYFTAGNYNITAVTVDGIATVQVTAPTGSGLTGTRTLTAAGEWTTSGSGSTGTKTPADVGALTKSHGALAKP
jgi:type IV pilus assembly protein PilA